MVKKKVNKLIERRRNFTLLTIICSAIYILLFLALLLLSTPYPLFTFLVIASVAPSCWLFVHFLFKYRKKLENDINTKVVQIIKKEFIKDFNSHNISCPFDIKPIRFDNKNLAKGFHLCYSYPDEKLHKELLLSVNRVNQWLNCLNGLLPDLYHIDILLYYDSTLESKDIVV